MTKDIPKDIIQEIFMAQASIQDLGRFEQVAKAWRDASRPIDETDVTCNVIWKHACQRSLPPSVWVLYYGKDPRTNEVWSWRNFARTVLSHPPLPWPITNEMKHVAGTPGSSRLPRDTVPEQNRLRVVSSATVWHQWMLLRDGDGLRWLAVDGRLFDVIVVQECGEDNAAGVNLEFSSISTLSHLATNALGHVYATCNSGLVRLHLLPHLNPDGTEDRTRPPMVCPRYFITNDVRFRCLRGICVDSDGVNLLVAEWICHTVYHIDVNLGTATLVTGYTGDGDALNQRVFIKDVYSVAIDRGGILYVGCRDSSDAQVLGVYRVGTDMRSATRVSGQGPSVFATPRNRILSVRTLQSLVQAANCDWTEGSDDTEIVSRHAQRLFLDPIGRVLCYYDDALWHFAASL